MENPSNDRSSDYGITRVQGPAILVEAKVKLRRELGAPEFIKWIEEIQFVAEVDDRMVLAVRDEYAFNRVNSAYKKAVQNAWTGADPKSRTPQLVCWAHAPDDLRALAPDPWAGASEDEVGDACHMRFDTLVVGSSNAKAAALARRIAGGEEVPAQIILISGPQGVGKTHLLRALEREAQTSGRSKLVYISAEEFMSAYVEGAMKGDTSELKARVRNCDMLLLDDIQIIYGKTGTDREVLSTLRAVIGKGGKVIVTADAPLGGLHGLSAKLREELNGSAGVEINLPDDEMRADIVRTHAGLIGASQPRFSLSEQMLDLIVRNVRGPGRALSGAVRSLYFECEFGEVEPTPDMLQAVIQRQQGERKPPSIDMVKRAAMRAFHVAKADLEGPRKQRAVVYPRQLAMYLCREMTQKSLPQIGHSFGKRDHTTVLYAHRKITRLIDENPEVAADLARLADAVDQVRDEH